MNKYIRGLICTFTFLFCFIGTAMALDYPSSGANVPEGALLLTGTIIGEEFGYGMNESQGGTAAFDGQASTFYNPSATDVETAYCGIALSQTHILTQVCVLPRDGWPQRLDGAQIQGSNDLENWVTLYQFDGAPEEIQWNIANEFTNNTGFCYFRYFNVRNHGDVAELEFYGYPGFVEPAAPYPSSGITLPSGSQILRGELTGEEAGWGNDADVGRAAAFDGDINTSYNATSTGINDAWIGVAFNQRYVLTRFCLYPRSGWASRVQNACLQGSFDQENWITLYQFIDAAEENTWMVVDDFYGNIGYNYYRYISTESFGDVAEIELYGYAGALGDDPDNYTTKVDVTALTVTLDSGDRQAKQMTVRFGGTYEGLPSLPDREGKRFAGWYTAPEGGCLIDESTVVTRLSDHSIFAHWQ